MSVEEAVGLTQMAFQMREQRLFEGGAIRWLPAKD
jgi:hypothetical protein